MTCHCKKPFPHQPYHHLQMPQQAGMVAHPHHHQAGAMPQQGGMVAHPHHHQAGAMPQQGGMAAHPHHHQAGAMPQQGGMAAHPHHHQAGAMPQQGGMAAHPHHQAGMSPHHHAAMLSGADVEGDLTGHPMTHGLDRAHPQMNAHDFDNNIGHNSHASYMSMPHQGSVQPNHQQMAGMGFPEHEMGAQHPHHIPVDGGAPMAPQQHHLNNQHQFQPHVANHHGEMGAQPQQYLNHMGYMPEEHDDDFD